MTSAIVSVFGQVGPLYLNSHYVSWIDMFSLEQANKIFIDLMIKIHEISTANPAFSMSHKSGDLFCVGTVDSDPFDIILVFEVLTPHGLRWIPMGRIDRWGDFQVIEKSRKLATYALSERLRRRFYARSSLEKGGNT